MEPEISREMKALQRELADIELRVACREADTIDRLRMDLDVARSENARLKTEIARLHSTAGSASSSPSSPPPSHSESPPRSEGADTLAEITRSHTQALEAKDRVIATLETALAEVRNELVKARLAFDDERGRLRDDLSCRDEMLAALQEQLTALQKSLGELEAEQSRMSGGKVGDAAPDVIQAWDDGMSPPRKDKSSDHGGAVDGSAYFPRDGLAAILRPLAPASTARSTSAHNRSVHTAYDDVSSVGRGSRFGGGHVDASTIEALSRLWDDIANNSRRKEAANNENLDSSRRTTSKSKAIKSTPRPAWQPVAATSVAPSRRRRTSTTALLDITKLAPAQARTRSAASKPWQ